jgi:hypothetical protein
MQRSNDNSIGDLVISDSRLGIGTTDNLSTLTVRARGSFNLTGTVAKTEGSATVTGTSTRFLSELTIGDRIEVPGDEWNYIRGVVAIASDTSLTVESPFLVTSSGAAVAWPSAARFDSSDGTARVVVNDQGNVGIGTMGPNGQLHVSGTGAGDYASCPVNIHSHLPSTSDAWQLVLSTEAGDLTPGVALSVLQQQDDGGATLTVSVWDGEGSTAMIPKLTVDGHGLTLLSAFSSPSASIASDYTMDTFGSDHYLLADAGAGGITITLPGSSGSMGRMLCIIKSAGGGDVTITPAGTDKINGGTGSKTISALYSGIQFFLAGDNWIATVMTAA